MKDLSKHLLNYKNRMASVQKEACKEISTLIATRTPVDTGELRKSWTPSIGSIKADNSGGESIAAVVSRLKVGDTYNFANAQPYVRRIEYEGHSKQAPQGMFRRSVAEWQKIVREALAKAK